ncbi:MAG: hypothetical protein ACRELZ_24130, partial [Candidatus Rokuibacteriota bacterium]
CGLAGLFAPRPGHDRVEPGDVRSASNRDRDAARSRMSKLEEPTRPGEEVKNIVRPIGESIGGIVLASDDPPVPTTVGVDATTDELIRM